MTAKKRPPARTPEARENQLVSLAYDLAERQLLDGSASSQVITHFLKLGSTKDKKEQDILTEQVKLIRAKTDSIKASHEQRELYEQAINAMKRYSGNRGDDNDEEL